MLAINNIHHHPLSSDETSKPGPAFSFTLLGSRLHSKSLATWPGNQSVWETPERRYLLPSTCLSYCRHLENTTKTKASVNPGKWEKLCQTVSCWEFLSSRIKEPQQLSVIVQICPVSATCLAKAWFSMAVNAGRQSLYLKTLLLGMANTSTNHFMLISTLNPSVIFLLWRAVKNTGLILKIWSNSKYHIYALGSYYLVNANIYLSL